MAQGDGLQPPTGWKWMDELLQELRVKYPPPSAGSWLKYQNFVATLMVAAFTFFGAVYWRSVDKISTLRKTAIEAKSLVDQVQHERTARIAEIDQWRSNVGGELRTYRIAYAEFEQMKGTVSEISKKLSDGRDESLRDRENDRNSQQRDRDMIMNAVGDLKTQVALLGQSITRGAPGRIPEQSPFGDRNQTWIALPWPRPVPLILRVTKIAPVDLRALLRGS